MSRSSKSNRNQAYGNSKKNKKRHAGMEQEDMYKMLEVLLAYADENDELVIEGERLKLNRKKFESLAKRLKHTEG